LSPRNAAVDCLHCSSRYMFQNRFMAKIFFSVSAFLVACAGMTSVAHAASFCESDVQRAWPSWIGQIECEQQPAVPIRQGTSIPHIPEHYQSLMYERLLTQPAVQVQQDESASQAERAGMQWWPDWISKPLWY